VNLLWIIVITGLSAIAGTSLCFWLLTRAREVNTTSWVLQQVICPIIRLIVLMIIVSLVYPAIDEKISSLDFWRVLGQSGQFSDLLNILFLASLLLGFIPIINHPVFTLPLQSCLAIALVFQWQYAHVVDSLSLFPNIEVILEISGYMMIAYLVTRESSIHISRWIDQKLVISGSIRLVAEAIYLVLQIPVMLMYSGFLKQQLV
jgi:hypothetical protein